MQTKESGLRLLLGGVCGEDRGEERVEELHSLAAGDEDDDFVVLRELEHGTMEKRQINAAHPVTPSSEHPRK